jgi:hypothetical protein
MNIEVGPFSALLINGAAALSATGLVLASTAPPGDISRPASALSSSSVTLTAQMVPLPVQLFDEQVAFDVGVTLNWLTTGVALTQQIAQIPGTFVADVRAGTPVPTAAAEALKAFADIEFVAGRDLVGYAQDIADFQIHFAVQALSALPPFASGPGAQFVATGSKQALNTVQQFADSARSTVNAVQQFTDNALHTPPTMKLATLPTKATALQQHSVATLPHDTAPKLPASGFTNAVTHHDDHPHPVSGVHVNQSSHDKGAHRH